MSTDRAIAMLVISGEQDGRGPFDWEKMIFPEAKA